MAYENEMDNLVKDANSVLFLNKRLLNSTKKHMSNLKNKMT